MHVFKLLKLLKVSLLVVFGVSAAIGGIYNLFIICNLIYINV